MIKIVIIVFSLLLCGCSKSADYTVYVISETLSNSMTLSDAAYRDEAKFKFKIHNNAKLDGFIRTVRSELEQDSIAYFSIDPVIIIDSNKKGLSLLLGFGRDSDTTEICDHMVAFDEKDAICSSAIFNELNNWVFDEMQNRDVKPRLRHRINLFLKNL